MALQSVDDPNDQFVVRPCREDDYISLMQIYREGQLADDIDHHEIELDLDTFEDTYVGQSKNRLWLAEADGKSIGMISVLAMGEAVAQVRWLRVAAAWRETDVTCRLLQTATDHCRQHAFLKVVIMTAVRAERAVPLLKCLGFRYSRQVAVDGHHMHEFYLDLYSERGQGDCMAEGE